MVRYTYGLLNVWLGIPMVCFEYVRFKTIFFPNWIPLVSIATTIELQLFRIQTMLTGFKPTGVRWRLFCHNH